MSWKNAFNWLFKTVTMRLTVYYVVFFTSVSFLIFLLFYTVLNSRLEQSVAYDLSTEINEIAKLYNERGPAELKEEFKREAESQGVQNAFFALCDEHGTVRISSDMTAWKERALLLRSSGRIFPSASDETIKTVTIPSHPYKIVFLTKRLADGNHIEIGYTLKQEHKLAMSYVRIFGTALLIMLVCGGLIGYFITKGMMQGVKRITQTVLYIGKGDLSRRVPKRQSGKEIDGLVQAFNDMLTRIETLVDEVQEVSNNIAHDLRSPITRIRGIAETTLSGPQELDDYRAMTGQIIEECDRLVGIINTLLEIAEADAGVLPVSGQAVDLRRIVTDAYELFSPLFEDKKITFTHTLADVPLVVSGSITKLQRAIANVLDNAVKYTPEGGTVTLKTERRKGQVVCCITDTGGGIAAKDMPHIFERFYRGDKSRSTAGNGLGLSLVYSIVKAHKGEITINSTVGSGTTVTLVFPFGNGQ